ncbi:hypothetical protein HCN44_007136 [Aphidius gifuensis]|uniref:Peptidase S1 domain-containing protein n=1 Tax=Aphidius gifuensis TaxID=684658 RepID=A0A834XLB7_APHGI|nr:uncharacterized protein LOC122856307 [Aphidius gifuensis]KAF7988826.1 hypothetical protein HCN44_007136 [Aphidius gifuensis]
MVPGHCVECGSESNLDSLEVLAGTNKINNTSSGILYKVSDISCKEIDPNNNMAFLKLSNNITNQRTIGLGVDRKNDNVTKKETPPRFFVGWKIVEGKNSSKIEKIKTPNLRETCSKIFKELSLSPNNYLCTKNSEYDVCKGNSDHVLISDNRIIGIPTKIGCGKEGIDYNIFTRVE